MWASRRTRRQRAVLKLAWRRADALQICVGVFMKTLAVKCVFNYVCMEREQRSGSPSPIFIFTSIHEHLTPCRVCMCVSSDHMPASPLHTSAGWDAFFFFFLSQCGDRESVVVTLQPNNKAMMHILSCRPGRSS